MVVFVTELGGNAGRFGEATPGEGRDRRTTEEFEAHEAAYWVARQAKHVRAIRAVVFDSEPQRLAWTQCDLVEHHFYAELVEHAGHKIEVAGRYAAAQEQHVGRESLFDL